MILNVNTDKLVVFTNKLEKLHRSAFPVAVRGTLNKAAFDIKTNTMPQSAERTFVNRRKNFFKATSRVDMAQGFNLSSMKSTVGFIGNGQAVKDLEEQEYGGTIKGRSFIPTDEARTGGSKAKAVRPVNRLSRVKNIVNSNTISGKSKKQKFLRAAIQANKGGFVLGNGRTKMLYRIISIKKIKGRTIIKKQAIYSYEKGRNVSVSATGFMKSASLKSANDLDKFYIQEAERQFKKYLG